MIQLRSTLICETCPVTGELGLRDKKQIPKSYLTLDTGTGTLLAHDYVEHVNGINAIGSVEDELSAIAVAWAVRVRYSSVITEVGLSRDLVELYDIYARSAEQRKVPITHKHIFDEDFLAIIELARNSCRRESDNYTASSFEDFTKYALAYMRKGIRQFYRKYASTWPESQAWDNFLAIEAAVKNADLIEGAEYQLELKDGYARLEMKEIYYH
ncbi:hypothetical protein ALT721_800016 [Alteromonas alvinellae]